MKTFLSITVLCMLFSCNHTSESTRIQEGQWTGGLTPMNHPNTVAPLNYNVGYEGELLVLSIVGPGDMEIPARDAAIHGDTLRFVFNEPEENIPLQCVLGRQGSGGFAGRCTDAGGKWAKFTMTPPTD